MQYSNLESILIKNSQTGFYISTPDGKLLDCNDSFVNMFGYDSKEDVLSYNTTNFYFDIKQKAKKNTGILLKTVLRLFKALMLKASYCFVIPSGTRS